MTQQQQRKYTLRNREPAKPPDFARIMERLSDDDLGFETRRAGALPDDTHGEYRKALEAEMERRGLPRR